MGYGSYSYEAHEAITSSRAKLPAQEVFKQRTCHPLMNPKGVKLRECRDSKEHPESLGIVFSLDVSGSMGQIPQQIARKELPGFMKTLSGCGIEHSQVLFMAFSDVASNKAPLQVGQFETTAELMDQWLTWCWIEGGGATAYESYDLALHFAAHHTAMDCFEKRQHKGYLFMTGDEPSYESLKAKWVEQIVGDPPKADVPLEQVIGEVSRTFQPFFLIPDRARAQKVGPFWKKYLGEHAIAMESPDDACSVAAGLVALCEGAVKSLPEVATRLKAGGSSDARAQAVVKALTPFAKSRGLA